MCTGSCNRTPSPAATPLLERLAVGPEGAQRGGRMGADDIGNVAFVMLDRAPSMKDCGKGGMHRVDARVSQE